MNFEKGDFVQDKAGNKYVVMSTDDSTRPYKLCCIYFISKILDSDSEVMINGIGESAWVFQNNIATDFTPDSLTKITMPWDTTDPVACLPSADEARKQIVNEAVWLVTESIKDAVATNKFEVMVEFKNTYVTQMIIEILVGKGYDCTCEGKQLWISWKD